MGYKYFLISGTVEPEDVIFLTNHITGLSMDCEIEKKSIKNMSKNFPKLIFYVFDDVKFKNIWMFKEGILKVHFVPYMTYYPKNVTFFISDTGQDILFFKTTNPDLSNIMKIMLKRRKYKACNEKNAIKNLKDGTIREVIFTNKSPFIDNLMPYKHPGGSMEDIVYFYNKFAE